MNRREPSLTTDDAILLGYEMGSGEPVRVPRRHMAVIGQTQQSGKTTTLEAMIARAGTTALTFVTKRGESAFSGGHRVRPYFRDRADWKFVDELLEAVLQEKNKFLRPWIMKICRTTKTLAEVQARVRDELATARGIHHGVFTQLDAYLDMVVPEIRRAHLDDILDLEPGLNVMDVAEFATPMQMLFVQSALDWINAHCTRTTVVIPEAWEFVPERKGSPVKKSAETLVRKGGALGNHIWLDSQDTAGVDKMVLRACTVWLIGVQREANEIKRNIQNIPAGIRRPKPEDIAALGRGQFFASFDKTIVKVYVQPAWLSSIDARCIAAGTMSIDETPANHRETQVNPEEARQLRADNDRLMKLNRELADRIGELERKIAGHAVASRTAAAPDLRTPLPPERQRSERMTFTTAPIENHIVEITNEIIRRAQTDPVMLKVLQARPELEVEIKRQVIRADYEKQPGFLAALIARGFFDEPKSGASVVAELKRCGRSVHNANVYRDLGRLAEQGFLTNESDGFRAVAGMKINISEVEAA